MKIVFLSSHISNSIIWIHELRKSGVDIRACFLKEYTNINYKKFRSEALEEYAETIGFNLHIIKSFSNKESVQLIQNYEPDLLVLVWLHDIVKQSILQIPKIGTLNIHGAILPSIRGADSNLWAIWEDFPQGITAHFVDTGVDTGDIILTRKYQAKEGETYESMMRNIFFMKCEVLIESISLINKSDFSPSKQNIQNGKQYFGMHSELIKIVLKKYNRIFRVLNDKGVK